MDPLFLSDKQTETLIRYMKERAYPGFIRFVCAVAITVLTIPVMLFDVQMMQTKNGTAAATEVLGTMARRYSRYHPGEYLIMWCVLCVISVILFFHNYNVTFGPSCDLSCLKRGEYTLSTETCCGKSVDNGRHPYFIYDALQKPYKCPVFIDWKHLENGDEAIFVTLSNGNGYVLKRDENTGAKEWWEEDPY